MFAPENGTAGSMGLKLPGGDLSHINAARVFPLNTLDEVECFLDLSMRPPSWGEGFLVYDMSTVVVLQGAEMKWNMVES